MIAKEPYECTPILQQTTNLVHCELILFDETETPQPDIYLQHARYDVEDEFVPGEELSEAGRAGACVIAVV
jgi:hypothetical protein